MRRSSLARAVLAVAILGLWSQTPDAARADNLADDRFINLGPRDGLDSRVLDIVQDPQGFLWFATLTGLRRYDGSQIREYRHDPDDPTTISDNHVREMLVDSQGTLWIATALGRLDRWIPEDERFRRLEIDLGGSPEDLVEAAPGHLLVALAGRDVVQVSIADGAATLVPTMEAVECAVADPARDAIWAFGIDGLTRHAASDLSEQERFPWPASLAETDYGLVLDCMLARDGQLWGAVYTLGAVRFEIETGRFTVYQAGVEGSEGLAGNDLTTVFEDSAGVVWVAGFSGLHRWLSETSRFERFESNPADRRSVVHHQIHEVFEDRTGQLWLGTDFGAARLDLLREEFQFYSHDPTRDVLIPEGSIRSFTEDEDGRVWIGSRNDGITRMDRRTGETMRVAPDPAGGCLDGTAWALSYEAPDRLWIGSEIGLSRLDVATGTCRTCPSVITDGVSPRILVLFRDRLGALWAGSSWGLYRHDPVADTFDSIPLGGDVRIVTLADDSTGRLFVGTEEAGILVLDARTGRLSHRIRDRGPDAAPQGEVSALLTVAGPPETVWAATLDGGLYRLEADGEWRRFGLDQGLFDSSVRALEAEDDGTLWVSTGLETVRFDPRTGAVQSFRSADGLPALVHYRASYSTRGGEILFGGLDGFVAFQPDAIRVDSTPPRVVLTDFRIGDRSMRPRSQQPDSPLATSITVADSVTLSHRQNDFTIELAALHFGDPERNRFAYRLDGVDTDWIEVPANRSFARYSSIPPGRHQFRAKAANRDGVWSEDEARLEIRVLPAPWRSGWAWALYTLGVVGLVAWWIRARIVRLELEKELQEKELKILRGLLPICASCKKIRDDEGEWEPLELYLDARSEAQFSHGICPQCAPKFFDDLP